MSQTVGVEMAKVDLNFEPLKERLLQAFEGAADEFTKQLPQQFDDDRWQWPRRTRRASGEVIVSPRDIVDLGTLRDSMTHEVDRNLAQYRWPTDYAASVFLGATFEDGRPDLPARNLPREAMLEFPWLDEMRNRF